MKPSKQSQGFEDFAGSPSQGEPEFLVIGRLRRPHGVLGEILMEVLTDFPERIQTGMTIYLGDQYLPARITSTRSHMDALLISIENYEDRESVGELRNLAVYIPRSTIPPLPVGEFYHHQIIGLQVLDETGTSIGYVVEILETGANDVLIVKAKEDKQLLIPVIDDVVREIDLSRNCITIHPLPGLLPDK